METPNKYLRVSHNKSNNNKNNKVVIHFRIENIALKALEKISRGGTCMNG